MKKNTEEDMILKISSIELYNELVGRKRTRYKFSIKRIRASEWELNTVGYVNNMKIEVRSSEKGHNLPHFHVTVKSKEIDAVYTIDPIELYEGEVTSKVDKAIVKWAETNRDKLVDMWNEYHGYRIKVS